MILIRRAHCAPLLNRENFVVSRHGFLVQTVLRRESHIRERLSDRRSGTRGLQFDEVDALAAAVLAEQDKSGGGRGR